MINYMYMLSSRQRFGGLALNYSCTISTVVDTYEQSSLGSKQNVENYGNYDILRIALVSNLLNRV